MPGYDGSGSYYDLAQKYANDQNSGSNMDTVINLSPLSFTRAGRYDGSPGYLASRGGYWSPRGNSQTGAYRLNFYASILHPQYSSTRGFGLSLRCLAR